IELSLQRGANELGIVPEENGTEAIDEIDVAIAVNVPEISAFGTLGCNRIEDFLPARAESRDRARVGQVLAMSLRQFLGFARALAVKLAEGIEIPLLIGRQRSFRDFRRR